MLTFTCPLCGVPWPVPDGKPGRTEPCTQCGRRVLLPPWAPPRLPELPPPQPAPLTPLRLPSLSRRVVLGLALALALGLGAAAVLWIAAKRRSTATDVANPADSAPPAASAPATAAKTPSGPPSEAWSHADLIAHLRKQGLRFDSRETDYGSLLGPAMLFAERGEVTEAQAATLTKSKLPPGYAFVQRRKTPAEAREACAKTRGRCFAWGRFYVTGDAAFTDRLKAALP